MFKAYPKIHRIGKAETEGILNGTCHVEEKIDGANVSIWLEDGVIQCASRSQKVTSGFNGFVDFVNSNESIKKCLLENPNFRLYGEWLVRHTIAYNELSYKKFYLFDILEDTTNQFLSRESVLNVGETYSIPTPMQFGIFENPTVEELSKFVGKSCLGENGEGVVIKNLQFVNTFGSLAYAKIVSEKFKEDNGVIFGGNNRTSVSYWEIYVVNKYMTLSRVQKIMNKIQPLIDEKLDLKHTSRVISTCYHDMLVEEIWEIQDRVETLNFKNLKKIACKKASVIYKELLTGDVSVAHQNK